MKEQTIKKQSEILGKPISGHSTMLKYKIFWGLCPLDPTWGLRACSHEPRTVNYPGVIIALGQALPRVHMMICYSRASSRSSDHYEII